MRYVLPRKAAAMALAITAIPGAIALSVDSLLANIVTATRSASTSTATDLAALKAAVLAGNYTSHLDPATRNRCPRKCSVAGVDSSSAWYVYHSVERLDLCNSTMLLDLALANPLDSTDTRVSIAACTGDLVAVDDTASTANSTCQAENVAQTQVTSSLQLTSSGASNASSTQVSDVVGALDQLQALLSLAGTSCNEMIRYAYSGHVAVGVYVGSGLASQGVMGSVLDELSTQVQSDSAVAEQVAVQMEQCENSTYAARYSLGVFVDAKGDLAAVQAALQQWRNSTCVSDMVESTSAWQNITFLAPSLANATNTTSTTSNSTVLASRSLSFASVSDTHRRDTDCTTIQVVSGDTCATLAAECGITAAEFTTYNPSSTLCSALTPGEHVCCSSGTLPDYAPSPDADGYCYSYTVQSGDTCSALAAAYDITVTDIETYNEDTWGWNGCSDLLIGNYICLSSGDPPMPAVITNAVCGPQVNGTAKAPVGTDLSTLNECPLNACCDIWGQCGTTTEFCTISNSTTGAPGTAAAGENGCISNCGTTIVVSASPAEVFTIGYFEGFDWSRPCLNGGLESLDTSSYTHIHFAFATINADWSINTTAVDAQFPLFLDLSGVKKIISIGGWDFSTDADTYMIFRDVVASESSRATLITNIVNFLVDNDLDGVDIDWEYPDEPDIPDIPAGSEADATGFFLLCYELQASLAANAAGKTLSITVPASYWYLQYFPVLALSEVVDYLVYMTYDIHGQWDYGNAYVDPGCPDGDCLRSHINLTETINALSMITKADVPSDMIAVGVSSYARSFEMTTAGCWTDMCTYTGPTSGALPGICTETAGYISQYELDLILAENPSAEVYFDENSYSSIMVYNGTQWAAYMNDSNKAYRRSLYADLTFLGSSDWAIDLQTWAGGAISSSSSSSTANETIYINPDIWDSATPIVTALPGVTLIWPPMPLASTTTITFPPWETTVSYSSLATLTSTLTDGSTSTYLSYVYVDIWTTLTIPPVTTTAIPVWGVSLSSSSTGGTFALTSSVQPEPFVVTVTPVANGTTSIIGATETTTSSGLVVVWGGLTDAIPTQTETKGGTTTIIGGTTLAPKPITVTPNPHPTTVPSTTDPVLNSKTPSWTSGSPPVPTAPKGCLGCGIICLLFCDPDCPFCDPGVFGSSSGSGSDDDEDNSSSSSSSSATTVLATIMVDGSDYGDYFPYETAAASVYSSLDAADNSMWDSMFPDTPIITATTSTTSKTSTTSTKTPTTTTTTASQSPTATCYYWVDDLVAYEFDIWDLEGNWGTDDIDSALHKQEDGCGALTYWTWTDATSSSGAAADFILPFLIKSGCVERAIVSAGGPSISCQFQGYEYSLRRKREEELVAKAVEDGLLEERSDSSNSTWPPGHHALNATQVAFLKTYYNTTYVPYEPEIWSTVSASAGVTASATG